MEQIYVPSEMGYDTPRRTPRVDTMGSVPPTTPVAQNVSSAEIGNHTTQESPRRGSMSQVSSLARQSTGVRRRFQSSRFTSVYGENGGRTFVASADLENSQNTPKGMGATGRTKSWGALKASGDLHSYVEQQDHTIFGVYIEEEEEYQDRSEWIPEDEQITVMFRDLHTEVKLPGQMKRQMLKLFQKCKSASKRNDIPLKAKVLQGATGIVEPGNLCAIMGPSGGGKTSLLEVLSGRNVAQKVTGCKYTGGIEQINRVCGFVSQFNNLDGRLSVRESVRLSAKLRTKLKADELEKRVDEVIAQVGLSHVQHNRIGSDTDRGISGGQAKRVSIAMELVIQPALLFADEPTTGLDSTTAEQICKLFHDLSRQGRTVIMTIHQPRASILDMLDQLIMLMQGQVAFIGTPMEANAYFNRLGFNDFDESGGNRADHYIDIVNNAANRIGPVLQRQGHGDLDAEIIVNRRCSIDGLDMHDLNPPIHTTPNDEDEERDGLNDVKGTGIGSKTFANLMGLKSDPAKAETTLKASPDTPGTTVEAENSPRRGMEKVGTTVHFAEPNEVVQEKEKVATTVRFAELNEVVQKAEPVDSSEASPRELNRESVAASNESMGSTDSKTRRFRDGLANSWEAVADTATKATSHLTSHLTHKQATQNRRKSNGAFLARNADADISEALQAGGTLDVEALEEDDETQLDLLAAWQDNVEKLDLDRDNTACRKAVVNPKYQHPNLFKRTLILTKTNLIEVARAPGVMLLQLVVASMFALLISLLVRPLGKTEDDITTRQTTFYFIIINLVLMNIGAVEAFVAERPRFIHEITTNFYSPGAYLASKFLGDIIPVRIFPSLVFSCILYWLLPLQANFGKFLIFTLFLVSVVTVGVLICWVAALQLKKVASSITVVFVIFMISFLFMSEQSTENLSQLQYFSFCTYAYQSFIINELNGLEPLGPCTLPPPMDSVEVSCAIQNGTYFLENVYEYQPSWLWRNFGILVAFGVVAYALCYASLKWACRKW